MENYNQFIFGNLVDSLITDIDNRPVPNNIDNERCFIWDNQPLQNIPYVINKVQDCPLFNHFYPVDIPPYRPKIAPIEYLFFEIANELERRYN